MLCDVCSHKEVCGKKEKYRETYEKLNKENDEFEVELKCRHYQSSEIACSGTLSKMLQESSHSPYKVAYWDTDIFRKGPTCTLKGSVHINNAEV